MHLSQNLKQLLKQWKLSESELGRQTKVPQQVINRILSGKNQNPTMATLRALADYFSLSISQLIGQEHQACKKIPFLEWNAIGLTPIEVLLEESQERVLTDKHFASFATKIQDDSMEPKFSVQSLLIFNKQQNLKNEAFVLVNSPSEGLRLRQIFIRKTGTYQKSLNPNSKHYQPCLIESDSSCLGLLIQSQTDFVVNIQTSTTTECSSIF